MSAFSDFQRSGNLAADPETYELENAVIARNGALDRALADLTPWSGRDLVDIGCGTGYWLPHYADLARSVVGVEPDPDLVPLATDRVEDCDNVTVVAGSAECIPLPNASCDVAHARFAYFFGPGSEAGLVEVARVLRRGGVFAAIDNDWGWGEFAEILRVATTGNAALDPDAVDAWWRARGATRTNVRGGWSAQSPAELERILRLEFPGDVVDRFLRRREPSPTLTYGVAVYTMRF